MEVVSGYYFYNLAYTNRAEVGALGKEATRTDVPYIYIYIYPLTGGRLYRARTTPISGPQRFRLSVSNLLTVTWCRGIPCRIDRHRTDYKLLNNGDKELGAQMNDKHLAASADSD